MDKPVQVLALKSGCRIVEPLDRLRRFCAEEYDYYDAVLDHDPDHVSPGDVAITIAVNSFVNTAARLRQVHRGLAEHCDPILARCPVDADLNADDAPLDLVEELLAAAVNAPYVLIPVVTKVLHRKRPLLIPMLDQVVLDYYLNALDRADLRGSTQDKKKAATTAMIVLRALRSDALAASRELDELKLVLGGEGFHLTPIRILDILLWSEVEPQGYYRV